MKIEIKRLDEAFLMEARNENGNTLQMDSTIANGGSEQGFRPMQMLLAALGGCSAIDVIHILKKQHADLEDIRIEVEGMREEGATPSLFKDIHLRFYVKGGLSKEKAQRAVELSMEKYCSVAKTLEPTAKISYEVVMLP
ncbi:MAG: OsmC family peroxiredoxin [Cytophagales bacterium]|nr:MAG: OsmC family peroxiredoxin [Cytophagales bacterium]